jgi:DNA polymerase III sliding clamp (beta) subunit (PCNA family)
LSDFILNNKDESIEITTEGTIAKLKSNHFEATYSWISSEEFPTVPEPSKDYNVKIERKSFLDGIKKVAIAPALDETRQYWQESICNLMARLWCWRY